MKEKERDYMSFQHAILWYWCERYSLLEQELLQEINCSVLQPSPTGSDNYFVERSIFFIHGSLCSKRYNKSLYKTLFMSIRCRHTIRKTISSFDTFHDPLREGEKKLTQLCFLHKQIFVIKFLYRKRIIKFLIINFAVDILVYLYIKKSFYKFYLY